jgi:type I restriction enzyme S subunit
VGQFYYHEHSEGPACHAGYLVRFRPRVGVCSAFVAYWAESKHFRDQVEANCIKTTIENFNGTRYGNLNVPDPQMETQVHIVAFLDKHTAQADLLVYSYEKLIELLEEKRVTIITQAVTRGLVKEVSVTDTSIASIGELPSHWSVLPLRRVIAKFVDYRGSTPSKIQSGIQIVTAANVKRGHIDYEVVQAFISEDEYITRMTRGLPEIGDVLLTMEAPLGQCAQVDNENISLGQRVMLLKANKKRINSDFLKYYLLSQAGQDELLSQGTGSTALGIKASKLKGLIVPCPPLCEQEQIVEHLNDELRKLDRLGPVLADAIKTVLERRSTLITAAVTGQIDVCSYDDSQHGVLA